VTDGVGVAPRPSRTHAARGHAVRGHAARAGALTGVDARGLAVSGAVCAILVTAVPLALLQIPDGAAWLPAGTADPVGLLRACGVALPALIVTAPGAAIAVRHAGTGWPVLLAGLLTIALADLAGGAARTAPLLAADRLLHGAGAGLILPGAAALAMSRAHAGSNDRARWITAVWATVTVGALAWAPALVRARVQAGATRPGAAWHAMIEPYPWLPVAALLSASAYILLAGGRTLRRRDATGDRARLAVTAPPLAALGVMVFAISYRTHGAVIVTAVCELMVLATLCRLGGRTRLKAIAALAGFTLMPFGTILPVYALVPLAIALAVALTLGAGRKAMTADETTDVLLGVSMMVAAVGAGYLWLTMHG
jgi:hypothetical protein